METNRQPMTRPELFVGMNHVEMGTVQQWLESRACHENFKVSPGARAVYMRGVKFGLGQVCMGFAVLPGASALSRPWKDAFGTEWQWDEASFQPVNDLGAQPEASGTLHMSDLPDEDFVALAKGLLDSIAACGWIRRPQSQHPAFREPFLAVRRQ